MPWYTWRLRFKVFTINLVSILAFLGAGYAADRWLGTRPFGIFAGLILSVPVTLAVLRHYLQLSRLNIPTLDKNNV